jgi:hypothetical protein
MENPNCMKNVTIKGIVKRDKKNLVPCRCLLPCVHKILVLVKKFPLLNIFITPSKHTWKKSLFLQMVNRQINKCYEDTRMHEVVAICDILYVMVTE